MSMGWYWINDNPVYNFINLLSEKGSVDKLCEIFKSLPESDSYGMGNDQPGLLRILANACGSSDALVCTNAVSVLLRVSNQLPAEGLALLLEDIVSFERMGSGPDVERLREEAGEKLKECRAIIARHNAIKERCDEITLLQRASRLSNATLRSEASAMLIVRSRELLPEIRMDILEGLVMMNMLDKDYFPIAKEAADEIVRFCKEKKRGQHKGERRTRTSFALRFFASLIHQHALFLRQIEKLEGFNPSIGFGPSRKAATRLCSHHNLMRPPKPLRRYPQQGNQKIRGPQRITPICPPMRVRKIC